MEDHRSKAVLAGSPRHRRGFAEFAVALLSVAEIIVCVLSATLVPAYSQVSPEVDAALSPAHEASLQKLSSPVRAEVERALSERNYQRVEEVLVFELEKRPDADLYVFAGQTFFRDGKFLNAGIALKKADAMRPLNPRDRFLLAMCYVVLKMEAKARDELETLADAEPASALYRYWLARIDYDAQHFPQAIAGFEHALKLDPGMVRAHDNLALSLEAMGRNNEAIAVYRRAVDLNRKTRPCSAWPPLNLAILLRKTGSGEEDVTLLLHEAIECDGNNATARHQMGLALESTGAFVEAIASFERAVSIKPDFADPYYALSRLYRRTGDKEGMKRALETFRMLKAKEKGNVSGMGGSRSLTNP